MLERFRTMGTQTSRRGAPARVLLAVIGTSAVACSQPAGSPDDTTRPDPDAPLDCSTPLTLGPQDPAVVPHGLLTFRAAGGSGQYQYTLAQDASGAVVHGSTGAYTAGTTADVVDRVVVQDAGCDAVVGMDVHVVRPMTVSPRRVSLTPRTRVTLDVAGGSGQFRCAPLVDASGMSVTPDCTVTAGTGAGQDTVRVTDMQTGQEVDAWFEVGADHGLRVHGAGGLFVPEGATFRVRAEHGSGVLDLSDATGGIQVAGDTIVATAPARGTVTVTDRFTGESAVVPVEVLAAFLPEATRDGERSGEGVVRAIGDKDGDGYADAVMGFIELSIDAHYGGGVAVYAGGPAGLRPAPVQVFSGTTYMDTMGRDVAVADIDGDGEVDLLIGDDKLDHGATNTGAVRVHKGIAGGWFEDTPSLVLHGEIAYDRLGTSLTLCDFDADGFLDLAVGAEDATDRAVGVPAEDQGGIYVYRGAADGFAERPDFVLYGQVPDGHGGWEGRRGLGLGYRVASGDLDGDGLCDLVATAPEASLYDSGDADGLVAIYRGTTENDWLLTRTPARLITGYDDEDAEFGHRLDVRDADDDGRAELAVAAWQAEEGASNGGAVYVFRGTDLSGDPFDVLTPDDARFAVRGTGSDDYLGTDVRLDDLDGSGSVDLVVSAYRAEIDRYGSGLILGYLDLGDRLAAPARTMLADGDADQAIEGYDRYDRWGQAFDVIGDADDDGVPDLMGLAGYAGVYGIEAGAPYWASGTGGLGILQLPGQAAGHDYGRGLALFDADGDGHTDLLVGAPGAGDVDVGANAGLVEAWSWTASGPSGTAQDILGGHAHQGGSDRFGWSLVPAGDFDGDGWDDLAVVSRNDASPSSWDSPIVNPGQCPGYRSSSGMVRVFRGGPDGLDPVPAFVWAGPRTSEYVRLVAGGFDHDGDGKDDLFLSSTDWRDAGGFAVVKGRAADPFGTVVICDAQVHYGHEDFDRLGQSMASLGDLDGDGCDDVAVGATGEELGRDWYNQGTVRVVWGWGGPGCAATPQVTTLAVKVIGTGLGSALASGRDVDGDGVNDLIVGGSTYRVAFAEHGVTWLASGAWIRDLPRQDMPGGDLPDADDTAWSLLLPDQGLQERYGVIGPSSGSLFGEAVAMVPDPARPGKGMVAVGAPQASEGDAVLGGGVRLYRFDPTAGGLDDVPWQIVGGEGTPGSLGEVMVSGALEGEPVLVVAAPASDRAGMDLGAVYVVPVR